MSRPAPAQDSRLHQRLPGETPLPALAASLPGARVPGDTLSAFGPSLALAPGATVDHSPRTFAGHNVYLVQQTTSFGTITVIVDSGTGRVVGTAAGANAGALEWPEEVTYAVVTEPGTRP